jgi:hypothetical protein
MNPPSATPRRLYELWIEEQIEEHKAALSREELLSLADEAVAGLFDAPDGQYPLTEILLCDAVDRLLFDRLGLPDFRQWQRQCRSDTPSRPLDGTAGSAAALR